jgi:hypothetical protein
MNLTPTKAKVISIIAFVIIVPIELLFFAAMVSILLGEEEGKMQSVFSMLFTMAIFFFPLRWAYVTWKGLKQKQTTSQPSVEVEANMVIRFQTKIDLSEYRKLLYILSYSNPIFIYLHVIGFGIFLSSLFFEITGDWYGYFSVLFLLYLPIAIYRNANTNYKATKAIHETLKYEANVEGVSVTGETFNTTMQWGTFHKARELKDWFLLYTNKQIAMLIPKKAFGSPQEVGIFREFIKKVG